MNKKFIVSAAIIGLLSSANVFAGECPGNYQYWNGHRSVLTQYYLSNANAADISVCVGYDVPSLWKYAAKNAVNRLNNQLSTSNSRLRYSFTNSNYCDVLMHRVYGEMNSNIQF